MQVNIHLPSAFSVHDENEFFAFQHLLARMNAQIRVAQVATGVHVNGGCTVYWGVVHHDQQVVTKDDIKQALAAAGFDFDSNPPLPDVQLTAAGTLQNCEKMMAAFGSSQGDTPDQACFADG